MFCGVVLWKIWNIPENLEYSLFYFTIFGQSSGRNHLWMEGTYVNPRIKWTFVFFLMQQIFQQCGGMCFSLSLSLSLSVSFGGSRWYSDIWMIMNSPLGVPVFIFSLPPSLLICTSSGRFRTSVPASRALLHYPWCHSGQLQRSSSRFPHFSQHTFHFSSFRSPFVSLTWFPPPGSFQHGTIMKY